MPNPRRAPFFDGTTSRAAREKAQSRELHPQCAASPPPYKVRYAVVDRHRPAHDFGRLVPRKTGDPDAPITAALSYDCDASFAALDKHVKGAVAFSRPASAAGGRASSASARPQSAMSNASTNRRSASPATQRPGSAMNHSAASPTRTSAPTTQEARVDAVYGSSRAFEGDRGTFEAQRQHINTRFQRFRCTTSIGRELSREQRGRTGYHAVTGPPVPRTASLAPLHVKYDAVSDWKKFAALGAHAGPAAFPTGPGHVTPSVGEADMIAARAAAPNNSEAIGDPQQAHRSTKRALSRGAVAFAKRPGRKDLWESMTGGRR